MKTRVTLALVALAGLTTSTNADWYNGDPDLVNGLTSETDTFQQGFISMIFEDFDHTGGNLIDVYGNFFSSTSVEAVSWEIRENMSPGNGGNLLASGSASGGDLVVTKNGFDAFGFTGFTMALDIPDLALGNGTYWLGLSVDGNNTGRVFAQDTGGANGVGSPIQNGNALWHSPNVFGVTYAPTSDQGQFDFSFGVHNAIPAPASIALLGLSGLVAGRRRRA